MQFGSNTFNGYMWITDTTYAVKSVVMHMDKSANINFVNKFEISQFYEIDKSKFLPQKNILYIDLNIPGMKKTGVIAKKTTLYKNIILNNDQIDTAFNKKVVEITANDDNDSGHQEIKRFDSLSKSEKSVYQLMDTLNKIPAVVTYGKIISAIGTGYYTSGNYDIGNLYSTYTPNHVEV